MHSNQYISTKHQCKYGGVPVVASSFLRRDRDRKGYGNDTRHKFLSILFLLNGQSGIQNQKI